MLTSLIKSVGFLLIASGLGENGLVLDSAEFLDLNTKKWTKTSSLKVGRTEHVMSLVYGIPTVIGGNYDDCTLLMLHIPINNFDIPIVLVVV